MLPNVPIWLTVMLNLMVYLFSIGVGIYALMSSYMKYNDINMDIYFDKTCINNFPYNECSSDKNIFFYSTEGIVLYILYIMFVILTGLCLILILLKQQKTFFNILSFLLLSVSIAGLVCLILFVKLNYVYFVSVKFVPEFTTASYLMIAAFVFMIIKQFFDNSIIRNTCKKILHLKH